MKTIETKLFVCFFILAISIVPVFQGISELKDRKSIQFFDIFEDTFITPTKHLNSISNSFHLLKTELNKADLLLSNSLSLQNDRIDTLSVHLDEALNIAENIKRESITINRHISDSTGPFVLFIDSIISEINLLVQSVPDDEMFIKDRIPSIEAKINQFSINVVHHNMFSYTRRTLVNFFKYTIFNHNYLRKYEKEMENSSIFAVAIRPVIRFANYAFFNDLGDKAILGKNGWMFYKPDVEYLYKPSVTDIRSKVVDYNSQPLKDDPVNAILNFKKQLAEMDIDLLVVIIPGKPSVYPDLINPNIRISEERKISHSTDIMKLLKEKGIEVIDLFHPFIQARQQDSLFGDSLYLRTDTHWKTRGLRIAASITAEAIKKKSWFNDNSMKVEYIIDSVEIYRNGDVGLMTKLPDFRIHDLQLNLPLEKTKCYQVFSINRNDSGQLISKTLYKDDYRKSRILILGDSFSRIYQTDEPRGAGWISHLAYEISEPVASIVNDGGASTIVRQTLSRKVSLLKGKKLVIWEFVERDLRFGAEGWKEIDITYKSSTKHDLN